MKALWVASIALILAAPSVARSQSSVPDQFAEPQTVSLCEVRSNEDDFVGKTIRVRALYVTDGFTFSDVRDDGCGAAVAGYGILNRSMHSATDETLRGMVAYENEQCSGRVMCPFKARLDADLTLRVDEENDRLGVTIEHVYSISRVE